jgi:hypothetical protein
MAVLSTEKLVIWLQCISPLFVASVLHNTVDSGYLGHVGTRILCAN